MGKSYLLMPQKSRQQFKKAGEATGEFDSKEAAWLTRRALVHADKSGIGPIPDVEEIQDMVEKALLESQYSKNRQSLHHLSGSTCPEPRYPGKGKFRSGFELS